MPLVLPSMLRAARRGGVAVIAALLGAFASAPAAFAATAAEVAPAQELALVAPAAKAVPARKSAPVAKATCPPPPPTLTPERVSAARAAARDHGLLWRAEKDGRVSWLYGTLHVAQLDWVFPGPITTKALLGSDVVALELNPLDLDSLKPLLQPADPGLVARVLTEPRRKRLARAQLKACVNGSAYSTMRPALRVTALSLLAGREVGLHSEFAIDTVLAGYASRSDKPIVALENAADQLALLAGRDEKEEGELVDGGLDEIEGGQVTPMLRKLAVAWAGGDEELLATYPAWCGCIRTDADRAQYARLLDDRNGPMADKIVALHTGGKAVFAAVGSLHMVGPKGLPELLRQRGFTVERVPPP